MTWCNETGLYDFYSLMAKIKGFLDMVQKSISRMSQKELLSCWPTGPFSLHIAKIVIADCIDWEEWLILMQWLRDKNWS